MTTDKELARRRRVETWSKAHTSGGLIGLAVASVLMVPTSVIFIITDGFTWATLGISAVSALVGASSIHALRRTKGGPSQ